MAPCAMLFASASLARRIERAEATLIAEFGRTAARRLGSEQIVITDLAGGIAVVAGPSAPFSKVAGLGFELLEEPRSMPWKTSTPSRRPRCVWSCRRWPTPR